MGADAPAIGPDGVHRGPRRQLEQSLPVYQVGGERLADSAHRSADPGALLLELTETAGQLPGHAVELLTERGELAMPGGLDRRGEVAAAELPGGGQEGLELTLQRPGGQQRGAERQHEERDGDQRGDGTIGADGATGRAEIRDGRHENPGRRSR